MVLPTLALISPPSFAADLAAGREARVQILLDGGDANTATIAQNYADAIVARFATAALPPGGSARLPAEAGTTRRSRAAT